MRADDSQVEIHPDRDKEQAQQDVAERLDVVLDLVAILGFRDQHSGEKRTERKRQSRQLGERREPEGDQQHVQHEQLRRTRPGDDVEPGAHRPLSEDEDDAQGDRGLGGRDPELTPQVRVAGGERRHGDEERDDREILKEQRSHHVAAVRGIKLHALGEHLGNDRRRAHGQCAAKRQPRKPAVAEQVQGDHGHQRRNRNLRQPEAEYRALHCLQLRQAELQTDREHQEDDAELRQIAHVGVVGHPAHRMGSDRDPDREVAQDRRQPHEPAGDDGDDGRRQKQQDQHQRVRHALNLA